VDGRCFRILYFFYVICLLNLLYLISKMRRALLAGVALLLAGVIAAREKTEPIFFLFVRVDPEKEVVVLRPMISPDIGVQLVSGAPRLDPRTAFRCAPSTREQAAIVDGQLATVSKLILDCGDHKFIVKGLEFTQRK
jgi:hypothetical protein